MAVIERSHVIAEAAGQMIFTKAGIPAGGELNGIAIKGTLYIDTLNGKLYINTGTQAATVWTVVGTQV